ncbi:AB hydrolase superfamily protein [Pleurotus pulmonarius]
MNKAFEVVEFVFDNQTASTQTLSPTVSLKFTAKRYRDSSSQPSDLADSALTLLFVHGVGYHKESWEPCVEVILQQFAEKDKATRIREAWAIDWYDHGDAALLNRQALKARGDQGTQPNELAVALSTFVNSFHVKGHSLVGIAYSLGSAGLLLSAANGMGTPQPYRSLVLVDPIVLTKELYYNDLEYKATSKFLIKGAMTRRDAWPSKDAALTWFNKRFPWSGWDIRVLRSFVEYGLEQTPNGVRLKCDKQHEVSSYSPSEGIFEAAKVFSRICHDVPIHVIWGETPDLTSRDMRTALSDASQVGVAASVSVVPETGHMVLLQQPDAVAHIICRILGQTQSAQTSKRAKL